jgi:hypothetical protein
MRQGLQGVACQGCRVSADGCGTACDGLRVCSGVPKGLGPVTALAPTAVLRPLAGRMPWG